MHASNSKKTWFILVVAGVAGVLVFGISACGRLTEIPEIPELPVRTDSPPTPNPTPQDEMWEVIEPEDNIYCAGLDIHPIGESISQTYDVTYEEVMRLYCSGFSFDNILLAFVTSQQTDYDYSPRELLQMKLTLSWDEIWNEVGIFEADVVQ